MKKCLLAIFAFMFLFPLLASGEQMAFSYRNDIKFGDSKAEVKGKENVSPQSEKDELLYYGNMVFIHNWKFSYKL